MAEIDIFDHKWFRPNLSIPHTGRGDRLPEIVSKTFLPPRWWLKIYFGAATRWERLICLYWRLPAMYTGG